MWTAPEYGATQCPSYSPPFLPSTLLQKGKKIEKKTQPYLETLTNKYSQFCCPKNTSKEKILGPLWRFVLFSRFQLHQQLYQCKSNYASCLLISRVLTLATEAYLGVSGASAFLGGRTGTPQKLLGVGEGV